jgi:hypothetical protein
MAKTGYIDLTTAEEEALLSYRRKKGVSQKSLLPACSEAWASLTTEQKEAWTLAGSYCALNGWRLFVRDYCYRVVNSLPGIATPNNYHQALVGQLTIEALADELQIIQPHPSVYFISKKVTGTKSQYEPVAISERLVLPLQIGLSYKADLTKTEADGYAKFYAIVRRLYQGQNLDQVLEIDLDLQTDWKTSTATLSSILGQYTSYNLYFYLYHLTGTLLVDNIKSIHTSQNWVRDFACQDIHQDFTRAFYQVPKHWSALIIPDGAFFESVYPT